MCHSSKELYNNSLKEFTVSFKLDHCFDSESDVVWESSSNGFLHFSKRGVSS